MPLHTQGLPSVEGFLFKFNFFHHIEGKLPSMHTSSLPSGFSVVFKASQRTIIVYAVHIPCVAPPPLPPTPPTLSLITQCQKNTMFVHSEGAWLRSRCVCVCVYYFTHLHSRTRDNHLFTRWSFVSRHYVTVYSVCEAYQSRENNMFRLFAPDFLHHPYVSDWTHQSQTQWWLRWFLLPQHSEINQHCWGLLIHFFSIPDSSTTCLFLLLVKKKKSQSCVAMQTA